MPYIAISGLLLIICYSTAKIARLVMSKKLKDKLDGFLELMAIVKPAEEYEQDLKAIEVTAINLIEEVQL